MANKERYTVKELKDLILKKHGYLIPVSKVLGCTLRTVEKYIEKYPVLQEAKTQALETRLDDAESRLDKAIRKNNLTAIIFFLKTRGKLRGYVEQTAISGAPNGGPIEVKYTIVDPKKNGGKARSIK